MPKAICSHNDTAGLEQKLKELKITLTFLPLAAKGKWE